MSRLFSRVTFVSVRRAVTLLPSLVLAGAGAVLLIGALVGSSELPSDARTLVGPPASGDFVAPAPEELSTAAVSRDWEEVSTSPAGPSAPRTLTKDPRSARTSATSTGTTLAKLLKRRK